MTKFKRNCDLKMNISLLSNYKLKQRLIQINPNMNTKLKTLLIQKEISSHLKCRNNKQIVVSLNNIIKQQNIWICMHKALYDVKNMEYNFSRNFLYLLKKLNCITNRIVHIEFWSTFRFRIISINIEFFILNVQIEFYYNSYMILILC